jgi:hypothetical protein
MREATSFGTDCALVSMHVSRTAVQKIAAVTPKRQSDSIVSPKSPLVCAELEQAPRGLSIRER